MQPRIEGINMKIHLLGTSDVGKALESARYPRGALCMVWALSKVVKLEPSVKSLEEMRRTT
jgi:hypothetical protein